MSLAEPVAQTPQTAPPMPPDGGTAPVDPGPVENAVPAEPKEPRAKPDFTLKAVGAELPQVTRATGNLVGGETRAQRFRDALVQIKAYPNTWYQLADYGAPTTAGRTARYLEDAIKVPHDAKPDKDGHVETVGGELLELVQDGAGTFEFKGQRVENEPKHSALYARYVPSQPQAQAQG